MIKLNKPQTKFFECAVNMFGSTPVKRKILQECADNNDVRLPVTVLKAHCQSDKRGYYDVSLSGITPTITIIPEDDTPDDFDADEDIQMAIDIPTPKPVAPKPKKANKQPKRNVKLVEQFNNPVYVMISIDNSGIPVVRYVCQSLENAWQKLNNIFHDNGNMKFKDAVKIIDRIGFVQVKSANSALLCEITKVELEN